MYVFVQYFILHLIYIQKKLKDQLSKAGRASNIGLIIGQEAVFLDYVLKLQSQWCKK